MKISANWLSDYVSHGLSIEDLCETLTMAGLEVDDVEHLGPSVDGVIIGHVLTVEKHPNADRLTVCSVDLGKGDPVSIICGATNVAAGQKVPVAPVGTTLQLPSRENPGQKEAFQIKKAKIRGETSLGMICAEDELGLSDDHAGIMVLDEEAIVGTPLSEYLDRKGFPRSDASIDIAITPNRPDAVCHVGIARDLAALRQTPLQLPEVPVPSPGMEASESFDVLVEAQDGCPRYVGILVRDVQIGPSPAWLQQRLQAVGLRPRNNIVDITNYVMYEFGQPLHAFDFDQLAGKQIIVRETAGKSLFTTLDGKQHELPPGTLMIADTDRDIAIAGVMGGENSEVTEATTNVLIESAYFNPIKIRKTAKALQIQTDASYRFERGIDPTGQARAASRAAHLMAELANGAIVPGMVDSNPIPYVPRTQALRPSRVEKVLGIHVPTDRIESLLKSIGFGIEQKENDLDCLIPPFRPDIEREIDIIEEVARLVGYDLIPEPTHSAVPNQTIRLSPTRYFRERISEALVGAGFREIVTNSMLSREVAEVFSDSVLPGASFGGEVIETLNPVSSEMSTLRPSLLPGALRVAGHNLNRGQTALRYFEFGNVQMRVQTERSILSGYTESECLLVLIAGEQSAAGWDSVSRAADIFDLKGVAENILTSLNIPDAKFHPVYEGTDVTSVRMEIFSAESRVGVLGRVADSVGNSFDLRGEVFFMELDWILMSELAAPYIRKQYASFSRHPVVERDIAVTVARNVPVGTLLESIWDGASELLKSVRVFDLYEGDQVGSGQKSIAFSLTFGSDRTLRDEEVEGAIQKIVAGLDQNQGAKLRQ